MSALILTVEFLREFCSTSESRPLLRNPFSLDGYTWATDGRLLVRVQAMEGVAEGGPANASTVMPAGDAGYMDVAFPPGFAEMTVPMEACEDCGGTGYFRPCVECGGKGEIECDHCYHSESCKDCDGDGNKRGRGKGEVPCDECDGTGRHEKTVWVALSRGEVVADLKLLRKAERLPGLRVRYKDRSTALLLDFEGGAGVLMPGNPGDVPKLVKEQWPG